MVSKSTKIKIKITRNFYITITVIKAITYTTIIIIIIDKNKASFVKLRGTNWQTWMDIGTTNNDKSQNNIKFVTLPTYPKWHMFPTPHAFTCCLYCLVLLFYMFFTTIYIFLIMGLSKNGSLLYHALSVHFFPLLI